MATNEKLGKAKDAKKDEFYTQYEDIQREMIFILNITQMYLEEKQYYYHVTTLVGVILQNFLHKTLIRLD